MRLGVDLPDRPRRAIAAGPRPLVWRAFVSTRVESEGIVAAESGWPGTDSDGRDVEETVCCSYGVPSPESPGASSVTGDTPLPGESSLAPSPLGSDSTGIIWGCGSPGGVAAPAGSAGLCVARNRKKALSFVVPRLV